MADDFSAFPEVTTAGGKSVSGGEFADLPEAPNQRVKPAGIADQGKAALEAGGRAALSSSGMVAGALSGAKLGAIGGSAIPGPGTLIGGVGGALVGGYLGYRAGDATGEGLGLRSAQELPENVRRGGVFGESVGGSIPFAVAPFAAGAMGLRTAGGSAIGRFWNRIVDTAARAPKKTLALEAGTALSAGYGAVVAEDVSPGNQLARSVGEIAFGAANPMVWVTAATSKASGIVKNALARFGPGGNDTEAGKILQLAFRQTGEDPELLARVLREAVGKEEYAGMTAAQITGSPTLAALERHYAKLDARFGADAANAAKNGLDALRVTMGLLMRTGDPEAFAAAGKIRQDYFRTLMARAVSVGERDAAEKVATLSRGNTAADIEQLSISARDALEKSLADVNVVEKELWDGVTKTIPAQTTSLRAALNEIVAEGYEEGLKKPPELITRFLNRVDTPKASVFVDAQGRPMTTRAAGTTTGEMAKVRSDLLDLARAAARDPDQAGMARIYSNLANAVMDDMDMAFRGAGDITYDTARAFTYAKHEAFTRSFAGKATVDGKYGDRVAPELLLTKALANGKQVGALQLRELEEGTRFLLGRGFTDRSSYETMLDAQEQFLRIIVNDTVDATTGRISPEKVNQFRKKNAKLLERFPAIEQDLRAAVKSEDRLRSLTNRANRVNDLAERQGQFGLAMGAGGRNAQDAAEAALRAADGVIVSRNPEAELDRLIRIAQGGGAGRGGRLPTSVKDSMDGLARALVESAFAKATPDSAPLNLATFRNLMTRPSVTGGKPLMTMMVEKGLMDEKVARNMQKLFQQADNIDAALRPATAVAVEETAADQVMTMASRIAGSKLAGIAQQASGSGGGSSIIVHGAAARWMDGFVNKLPLQSVRKAFTQAAFDPERMADMMTKIDGTQKSAEAAQRIHAWLVQSALLRDPEQEQPTGR